MLLFSPTKYPAQPTCPICAQLTGSDTCSALGIVARSTSPVLLLCRMLVRAGYDSATPLEAWRDGTLCLRIASIGEAAGLEVNSAGNGFIRHHHKPRAAPPVRRNKRRGPQSDLPTPQPPSPFWLKYSQMHLPSTKLAADHSKSESMPTSPPNSMVP